MKLPNIVELPVLLVFSRVFIVAKPRTAPRCTGFDALNPRKNPAQSGYIIYFQSPYCILSYRVLDKFLKYQEEEVVREKIDSDKNNACVNHDCRDEILAFTASTGDELHATLDVGMTSGGRNRLLFIDIMTVIAKFFASFQDVIGTNTLRMSLDGTSSVADLITQLELQHPGFDGKLEKLSLVAVNEKYSHRRQELSDGDVVAFFPPVSGG